MDMEDIVMFFRGVSSYAISLDVEKGLEISVDWPLMLYPLERRTLAESIGAFHALTVGRFSERGRETVNTISLGSWEYDRKPPICLSNLLESGRTVPR